MGCGSSSDKGREQLNQDNDQFFPPPNNGNSNPGAPKPAPTAEESKTKPLNQPVLGSNTGHSGAVSAVTTPVSNTTPRDPSKDNHHPKTTSSTNKPKAAYVPPSPITAAVTEKKEEKPQSKPHHKPHHKQQHPAPHPPPLQSMVEKDTKKSPADEDDTNIAAAAADEASLQADDILDNLGDDDDDSERGARKGRGADFGELTLDDHFDQAAISVITEDLQSEVAVTNPATSTMATAIIENDDLYDDEGYPINSPEPNSASGMRFDELYRLKGVLGTGAFSTVREGFHRNNSNVSYAVKCINRNKLSEEDEAALLDEVSILQEMKHPHIIRLFDFFTEPSTYYLVMERMRGGELFDRIVAKAYYNEKEARDTCKIVLKAVGYCHENHVAHRDLKPENLLLLSEIDDSAVKIADFGFAKKVYEPNSLTTQCGTPGYVAPEILEGTAYDERADMWSVGVILYILLGGYPPFIESTQRDLFRKIRKGDYEFHEEYWGTVSQDAKELISSLLTVSATDRLTASQALSNAWILGDDAKLLARDLGGNLEKLRNFNAKRKFRAAVSTVMAVNKLNLMGKEFFSSMGGNPNAQNDAKEQTR